MIRESERGEIGKTKVVEKKLRSEVLTTNTEQVRYVDFDWALRWNENVIFKVMKRRQP